MLPLLLSLSNGLKLRRSHFLELNIPDAVFDVTQYGAKGDGKTIDTAAIQAAIDAAAKAKGGTVLFPAGHTFLTRSLKVNGDSIHFNIPKGAVIKADNDRAAWGSSGDIIGGGVTNFAITGGGLLDGQGLVWWQHRDDFRPEFLHLHGSSVLVADVTFKDGPNHNLELYTDHTELAGVTILAPPSTGVPDPSHNTDAVDVHGSPFYIHDCVFNVGDDNVAVHANHTLVENCHFGTGHGASIGSICNEFLHNITFRNIVFTNTTTAIRIKTKQGCEGSVSGVVYRDMKLTDVGTSIEINQFYTAEAPEQGMKVVGDVHVFDIKITNITAVRSNNPGSFQCNPPCTGIALTDISHSPATGAWKCSNAHGTAVRVSPASCLSP